jgi:hypothetical protein
MGVQVGEKEGNEFVHRMLELLTGWEPRATLQTGAPQRECCRLQRVACMTYAASCFGFA